MINAELSYNPYLMETEIHFNGQPPRINSLVEKYQHMNLQSWISKIPKIFYDELNGYYFELDFSGTELDFEALCNTFRKAGITEEIVPIVHKGNLEGRLIKQKELGELLEWLKNNPNKRFDYDAFRADNTDLFDGGYSYVFLHGHGLDEKGLEDMNVSVELVDKVSELDDTDLDGTPILIHIIEKTLPMLAAELNYFKNRKDVTEEQIFFHIGEMLDERTVDRIIRDLGVVNPKLVKNPEDTPVRKYIEVYPVTAYVRSALTVLKIESSIIEKDLKKDNEESIIKNREIHEKIDGITDMLARLKNAEDFFNEFSDSAPNSSMHELEEELLGKINDWRSRKTKINKIEEARAAAADFEKDTGKLTATYANKIKEDITEKIEGIKKDFEVEYKNICYDNFEPQAQPAEIPDMNAIESFADKLMEMKEERYVEAKEDLIGMFFKSRQLQKEEREMVLETTFYYKVWRDHVAQLVKDGADDYIDKLIIIYKDYLGALRKEYLDHISSSIEVETNRKNEVSSQLSDDEKLLQIDNEWFETFVEQRMAIERG